MFLSVGHDEYWSAPQRSNVEAARNVGVHLAFFSGNEVFWKTRWERASTARTRLTARWSCYKETHANAKIDPPRSGPALGATRASPAGRRRPARERAGRDDLHGQRHRPDYSIAGARSRRQDALLAQHQRRVRSGQASRPRCRWVRSATSGTRNSTTASGPPGLVRLSIHHVDDRRRAARLWLDLRQRHAHHALTQYRHSSGARVFGAGTIQWSWGLDANHDGPSMRDRRPHAAGDRQPVRRHERAAGPLQPGLVAATASTDSTAPTSAITAPAAGANLPVNSAVTITGTAADVGGVVGGIEVSVDGGNTWRRANGRASWSYSWTPTANGTYVIRSRAVDDSGNLEAPGAGITVTAGTAPPPRGAASARHHRTDRQRECRRRTTRLASHATSAPA